MLNSRKYLILLAILPYLAIANAEPNTTIKIAENVKEESLPIEELQEFADIFVHIKRNFVKEINDKELLEFATKGMLANLDPHSNYLNTEEFEYIKNNSQGNYYGLGLELSIKKGNIVVVTALDNSPAKRAGLKSGDIVASINNQPTENMSLIDVSKSLNKKSKNTFSIVRKNQEPFIVVLEPNWVAISSVNHRLLEKNFGYIRISQFQEDTGKQTHFALQSLEKANKGKLLGVVLDLRDNPGGILQEAVGVADNFLADGLIVYTQGRTAESEMSFSATNENSNLETYLVVLVNAGTASAAEIVAGAIQDRRRGIILGTPTFGKGSVQEIVALDKGKGLKLTTALYYTPNGKSIQAQGIIPDLILQNGRLIKDKSENFIPHEFNLQKHIANAKSNSTHRTQNKDLTQDFVLYEALNILKGLTLFEVAP